MKTNNRDNHGVSLDSTPAIVLHRVFSVILSWKILDLAPILACDCGSGTFFNLVPRVFSLSDEPLI